ncbi:predicted GPI-anchored protein 58 [Miscanthus floridulus]|uniref:predicted GPI-anchored protein 58 n=1 Tax=Miscanthus floridulus TaxID=154761 RepID=UPI00345A110D
MEPGLKVPLLYTAASLLSFSSSIVFVFSVSPELCRRRFASPATPDAAFLTRGHPKAHPPRRSSPDTAPSPRSPRPPSTQRARHAAADFAFPATPDAAFLTGGHPDARPPRWSSPDAAPLKEEPLAAPDAAPSSSPEGIPTPTHTSPE